MADLIRVGLNYRGPDGVEKRAEAGEIVSDLPEASRGWLIAQGVIVPQGDDLTVPPGTYANTEEMLAAARPSRKRGK